MRIPHHFGRPDPNLHKSETPYPGPNPQQSVNARSCGSSQWSHDGSQWSHRGSPRSRGGTQWGRGGKNREGCRPVSQIRTKSWILIYIKVKIGSGSHKVKSRIRIIRHTTPELDLVINGILIIATVQTSTNSKT
jgi:hypothetical protein